MKKLLIILGMVFTMHSQASAETIISCDLIMAIHIFLAVELFQNQKKVGLKIIMPRLRSHWLDIRVIISLMLYIKMQQML